MEGEKGIEGGVLRIEVLQVLCFQVFHCYKHGIGGLGIVGGFVMIVKTAQHLQLGAVSSFVFDAIVAQVDIDQGICKTIQLPIRLKIYYRVLCAVEKLIGKTICYARFQLLPVEDNEFGIKLHI